MSTAHYYRDLLRRESHAPPPIRDDVLHFDMEGIRRWALERPPGPNWSEKKRAYWLVYSGLGLLVLGYHEHITETLELMVREPWVIDSLPCRGYIPALGELLPLPDGLDPKSDPAGTLAWYRQNRDRLRWSEEAGRYLLISERTESDGQD